MVLKATDRLPIKHLCLEVDDLDEVIRNLQKKFSGLFGKKGTDRV